MRPGDKTTYRLDIDGLRAVAVLAVVGFHAAPGTVRGGFVGLDIFFVISGFLITGIIWHGVDSGTFSFGQFYARRIRRIFPALIVVLLAILALGWVILLPDEYAQLGRHVIAGSLFASNFALWSDVGYFDTAAALKPLLNLWSLGIEEQFYLLWPLTLVAILKFRRQTVPAIAIIAAASFALNVFLITRNPTAAFYSPFARFWELMLGALLAMAPDDHRAEPFCDISSGRIADRCRADCRLDCVVRGGERVSRMVRARPYRRCGADHCRGTRCLAEPPPAVESRRGLHRAHQLPTLLVALAAAGVLAD